MAILIKGMKMPESCWVCKLCFCGYKCEATGESTMTLPIDAKLDTCPLIEVPPHGRLIDADALMENEENISFKDEWHMTVTEAFVSMKNIAHAPTIIEAEVQDGER